MVRRRKEIFGITMKLYISKIRPEKKGELIGYEGNTYRIRAWQSNAKLFRVTAVTKNQQTR